MRFAFTGKCGGFGASGPGVALDSEARDVLFPASIPASARYPNPALEDFSSWRRDGDSEGFPVGFIMTSLRKALQLQNHWIETDGIH